MTVLTWSILKRGGGGVDGDMGNYDSDDDDQGGSAIESCILYSHFA